MLLVPQIQFKSKPLKFLLQVLPLYLNDYPICLQEKNNDIFYDDSNLKKPKHLLNLLRMSILLYPDIVQQLIQLPIM